MDYDFIFLMLKFEMHYETCVSLIKYARVYHFFLSFYNLAIVQTVKISIDAQLSLM